jgi:hypothetical protein
MEDVPRELLIHLHQTAIGDRMDLPPSAVATDVDYFDYCDILRPILHDMGAGDDEYRLLSPYDTMFASMVDEHGEVKKAYKFNASDSMQHPLNRLCIAHQVLKDIVEGPRREQMLADI